MFRTVPIYFLTIAVILVSGGDSYAQSPIASCLHTVSIHVDGMETFNDLFDLLENRFKWPRLYGQRLTPERAAKRNYASFRVGNVNLEICGPYPSEFASGAPGARLHGLTFRPSVDALECERRLDAMEIKHYRPYPWLPRNREGSNLRFITVNDEAVAGPMLGVSIMERQNQADEDKRHGIAEGALASAAGGPLGVVRVQAFAIGFTGARVKWRRFLGYAGDEWSGSTGPSLRFQPGAEKEIAAVVIEVRSLVSASGFLREAGLLGEATPGSITIQAAKTHGMRIILRE